MLLRNFSKYLPLQKYDAVLLPQTSFEGRMLFQKIDLFYMSDLLAILNIRMRVISKIRYLSLISRGNLQASCVYSL